LLLELKINNFAIADDVSLSFGGGLNLLTGETGSGKTVIVNALSLLLGKKADSSLVRDGQEKASIEGIFDWRPEGGAASALDDAGVELEDGEPLIISREIHSSGRSVSRINSRAVPASLLRTIGASLADLHGQHGHQALLRKNDHTEFIDLLGPAGHIDTLAGYESLRTEAAVLIGRKNDILENRKKHEEERDLLRFRVNEIEESVDSEEAYLETQERAKRLEHSSEISGAASSAWNSIAHGGNESSALNRLAEASALLDPLKDIDTRLDSAQSLMLEAEAALEAAATELRSAADESESDPELLRELQDRIVEVRSLMKKNNCPSITELLEFRDRALKRISEIDRSDDALREIESDIAEKRSMLAGLAKKITAGRKKTAAALEKQMKKELEDLSMPGAKFIVEFSPSRVQGELPGPSGAETAEFIVATNPGEEPHPLAKVASGGELSRIMLAFKSILSRHDPVSMLVFDEIDAGVGGVTASHVGRKLAALAEHRQVITVTHLPQVAAFGATHVTVFKKKARGRTVLRARKVEGDERLKEIGRMFGEAGEKKPGIELARELVESVSAGGAP